MKKQLYFLNAVGFSLTVLLSIAPAISAPVVEQNHALTTGTYLGGSGDDQARGVGFNSTGEAIAGGNFANLRTPAASSRTLLNAPSSAPGKVLKLSSDGKRILIAVTLGQRIDDIETIGNRVVVGGDFGVAVLDANTLNLVWSSPLAGLAVGNGESNGGQTRVAIAPGGQVAALRAKTVTMFNSVGRATIARPIDRDFVTDVAINSTGQRVYVLGFANRRAGNPVQVPFLYALDQTLNFQWRTWDFNPALLNTPTNNNMADARLYRVVVGADNKVIVLGESAGGNAVFRWNGKDLTTPTLVKYDAYSDTYNSRSNHMLYYAKVDPATGRVLTGQYAVPRLDDNRANTMRAKDGTIAVDVQGTVYIGGVSAYGIAARNNNAIAGQKVAPS
jgi:hypothetical protein